MKLNTANSIQFRFIVYIFIQVNFDCVHTVVNKEGITGLIQHTKL